VRAEAFSNSAHPDDDAKHGRLRSPTGHGGVYKIDDQRQARAECRRGELNFSPFPGGAGAPTHPPFSFPLGWPSL
jgi:hypothetical protein